MAIKLDFSSSIPNSAQWVAIVVFAIGAIALIPQYITLDSVTVGYLALAGALLALALKGITTIPAGSTK
jgi:4-amino-4-deoxy-L-arabinose transferase-like glycosyltransferase